MSEPDPTSLDPAYWAETLADVLRTVLRAPTLRVREVAAGVLAEYEAVKLLAEESMSS